MPLKSYITCPSTGRIANVVDGNDEPKGLVVATRPLKTYENIISFFTHPIFGSNMNISVQIGESGSLFDTVYEDNAGSPGEWDASVISGSWVFNSVTQVYSGTVSIDGSGTKNNDVMQLLRSAPLDLDTYATISGYIYITSWLATGTKEIQITGWDSGTGLAVGNTVNIGTYIDTSTQNVWQEFSIPLSDMGLTSSVIDALHITSIGTPSPDYFLDEIVINEISGSGDSGIPVTYVVEPQKYTWMHVDTLHITMADNYDSTLSNATMPNIPYDGFLGLGTLTRGINYSRRQNYRIAFSLVFKDLIDLISLPGASLVNSGSDGINTWMTIEVKILEPFVLKSEDLDRLSVTIQDDLSSLLFLRVAISGKVENRGIT